MAGTIIFRSPAKSIRDDEILVKMLLCFLGIYVWELFLTCDFEWSIIRRKRDLRWPWTFFFLARYGMLAAVVGSVASMTTLSPVNCYALSRFNMWASVTAIASSTTSMCILSWYKCRWSVKVFVFYCAMSLGHWGLLYSCIWVPNAVWSTSTAACITTIDDGIRYKLALWYNVFFSTLLFCGTATALVKTEGFGFRNILFSHGLVFFFGPVLASIAPAVLSALELNDVLKFVTVTSSAVVATISACQAVIYGENGDAGDVRILRGPSLHTHGRQNMPFNTNPRPEVHITTNRFTIENADHFPSPFSPGKIEDGGNESA